MYFQLTVASAELSSRNVHQIKYQQNKLNPMPLLKWFGTSKKRTFSIRNEFPQNIQENR